MRVYRALPGHGNKGGKLYSFLGSEGLRIGQQVVAPYRHWISGKIHKTMWTLMQSNDADGQYGASEIDRLGDTKTKAGRDVQLRRIEGTDIIGSLPGGQKYGQAAEERGLSGSQAKALWSLSSNIKKDERTGNAEGWTNRNIARERLLGLNPKQDNAEAVKRILGE